MKTFQQFISESYAIAKQVRDGLDAEVKMHAAKLAEYPKGPMNLTPDHIKATPEWKAHKAASDTAFKNLQNFNSQFSKKYKKEIAADHKAKHP